jgi:hypothetical protein
MNSNVVKTREEVSAKSSNMLKTGDEMRASARERTRRCRAKQAMIGKKRLARERIVQLIVMIKLPSISIILRKFK